MVISKKTIIFQGSRGDSTFSRGGGCPNADCLFPIETHITCDFQGGGVRTHCPPLDLRIVFSEIQLQCSPFIMLCLGSHSIGSDRVKSELCY